MITSTGCSLAVALLIPRSILGSDFQGVLKRLKPEKHQTQLKPRHQSDLEFIGTTHNRPVKLLYDTTVYIDILQGRFPQVGEQMLRASEAWHSPVTEAELAVSCGLLDPAHSRTRENIEQIVAVIELRPRHKTITPDAGIWREAGILSGIVSRLQGYGKDGRVRILNDAILYASDGQDVCSFLTRIVFIVNVFMLLQLNSTILY